MHDDRVRHWCGAWWARWGPRLAVTAVLLVVPAAVPPAAGAPTACRPVGGAVTVMFADHRGCPLPLRPGDVHFGAAHVRQRDREVGGHPLDGTALERIRRAVA